MKDKIENYIDFVLFLVLAVVVVAVIVTILEPEVARIFSQLE